MRFDIAQRHICLRMALIVVNFRN